MFANVRREPESMHGWRRQASRSNHRNPVLACLILVTICVTILSLRDLNRLVAKAGGVNKGGVSLVEQEPLLTTKGWQAVAERALEHVEQLPRNSGRGKEYEKHVIRLERVAEPKPLMISAGTSGVPKVRLQPASASEGQCSVMHNTDYYGEALVWGYGNKRHSAADCCSDCLNYKPSGPDEWGCNLWVYCGNKTACGNQYRDCWLKHAVHPENSRPDMGPHVAFMSGLVGVKSIFQGDSKQAMQSGPDNDRKYHVVITAQGSAVHWQSRICYYWYLKRKEECEKSGPCDMGGFTRVLHSGYEDDLMDEIPTFVAQELPDKYKKTGDRGYVVINRPYAFVQWVEQANITEKYILMSEPDHLFLRPMPNLMNGETPAAFPFFYIAPSKLENAAVVRKFLGPLTTRQLENDVPPIGNAPTMLSLETMKKVAPTWMDMSLKIFNDDGARKEWGWVQEMYAFALAVYMTGIHNVTTVQNMMSQPPWDTELNITASKPFFILHYTYGMDYTLEGKFTPGKYGEWRFDKRSYASLPPKKPLSQPPQGMDNDLVRLMIQMFNQAMEDIPCWDEYSTTGRKTSCDH